jgi:hypothetical protein
MVLQVGQYIIIPDRMAQTGTLGPDVTNEQVNQEQTIGAGHKGVASGTQFHKKWQYPCRTWQGCPMVFNHHAFELMELALCTLLQLSKS